MFLPNVKQFYVRQIEDNFLPYWMNFADVVYGGVLNCISNDGKTKFSDDKFTWSQGRWLWVLSHIWELNKKGALALSNSKAVMQSMCKTYDFIKNFAIDENFVCCFRLSRSGEKFVDPITKRYDLSIYSDCFALIGISSYLVASDRKEEIALADSLFQSIVRRIRNENYFTEPYPVPNGYRAHGVFMILLNTFFEYNLMKEHFNQTANKSLNYCSQAFKLILGEFYDPNSGTIRELKSTGKSLETSLLDRYVNPGHIIEEVWFWIEYLEKRGDLLLNLALIERIFMRAYNLGWDEKYGGLLRFVDYKGGQPIGKTEGSPYEKMVKGTWDMKLWWAQSELLYTSLLMYFITQKKSYLAIYRKTFDYVFSIFPAKETGEWIQIRKRDGRPEERVVALPVKDPFHILRAFVKIIELML